MTLVFLEQTPKDGGRIASGCSMQGGGSTIDYIVQDQDSQGQSFVSTTDLANIWTKVLGDVDLNNQMPGDGRIKRINPMSHPMFPYWYATSIKSLIGVGEWKFNPSLLLPRGGSSRARQFPNFALYKRYRAVVEFAPSPFAILEDSYIRMNSAQWCHPDGSFVLYKYATERLRNTWYTMKNQFTPVTLPLGNFVFDDTDPNIAGKPFLASIKKFVPNSIMSFYWSRVPFRYVASPYSYLRKFVGMINQGTFAPGGFVGGVLDPGQLLYLGYQPTMYNPPVPKSAPWAPGTFSTEKLCDLELEFYLTNRYCSTVPGLANNSSQLTANENWIASGHNLQPSHLDNYFHYVAIGNPVDVPGISKAVPAAKRFPAWQSFPIELLFTDPDFPQPLTPGGQASPVDPTLPIWQTEPIVESVSNLVGH
jgi:hypothetical protein